MQKQWLWARSIEEKIETLIDKDALVVFSENYNELKISLNLESMRIERVERLLSELSSFDGQREHEVATTLSIAR